jgi:hypothetical protein
VSQEAFSGRTFFSSAFSRRSFSIRTTTTRFVFSLLFVVALALTLQGQVAVNQLSTDPS